MPRISQTRILFGADQDALKDGPQGQPSAASSLAERAQFPAPKSFTKGGQCFKDMKKAPSEIMFLAHSHVNNSHAFGDYQTTEEFVDTLKTEFTDQFKHEDKQKVQHIYLIGCEVGLIREVGILIKHRTSLAQEMADQLFKAGFKNVNVHAVASPEGKIVGGMRVNVIHNHASVLKGRMPGDITATVEGENEPFFDTARSPDILLDLQKANNTFYPKQAAKPQENPAKQQVLQALGQRIVEIKKQIATLDKKLSNPTDLEQLIENVDPVNVVKIFQEGTKEEKGQKLALLVRLHRDIKQDTGDNLGQYLFDAKERLNGVEHMFSTTKKLISTLYEKYGKTQIAAHHEDEDSENRDPNSPLIKKDQKRVEELKKEKNARLQAAQQAFTQAGGSSSRYSTPPAISINVQREEDRKEIDRDGNDDKKQAVIAQVDKYIKVLQRECGPLASYKQSKFEKLSATLKSDKTGWRQAVGDTYKDSWFITWGFTSHRAKNLFINMTNNAIDKGTADPDAKLNVNESFFNPKLKLG